MRKFKSENSALVFWLNFHAKSKILYFRMKTALDLSCEIGIFEISHDKSPPSIMQN